MLSTSTLIVSLLAAFAAATPIEPRANTAYSYSNIDPNASAGAKTLLKYLQSVYGKYTISGQHERGEVTFIKSEVGTTVALQGSDFIDYTPSRVQHGSSSSEVENAIAHDKAGGINAFVWHWNAPTGLYNTATEPWYFGFYTAGTSFNLQSALAEGTGGANYQLLLRDIDAIAVQIKRLSDAGVPILWRPLHEPDGTWFWWGAHGSAAFLQLWDLVYSRLTSYHGLHNMVWVCNTYAPAWYPGNSKCDIVAGDVYPSAGDHGTQASLFNSLYSVSSGQRMVAMSETGSIPDPTQQYGSSTVPWSYWMTWSGNFITSQSYEPSSFLKGVLQNSHVLTLDGPNKIAGWKSGGSASPPPVYSSSAAAKPSTSAAATSKPSTSAATTYKASTSAAASKPATSAAVSKPSTSAAATYKASTSAAASKPATSAATYKASTSKSAAPVSVSSHKATSSVSVHASATSAPVYVASTSSLVVTSSISFGNSSAIAAPVAASSTVVHGYVKSAAASAYSAAASAPAVC